MTVIDMDVDTVYSIIGDHPRFASPFSEPYGYCIAAPALDKAAAALYWERLRYAAKNAGALIEAGFQPSFYTFYGVDRQIVRSPADMCQGLIFDAFMLVFQEDAVTVECCLSNSAYMFGHYIGCTWDRDWKLLSSYIC